MAPGDPFHCRTELRAVRNEATCAVTLDEACEPGLKAADRLLGEHLGMPTGESVGVSHGPDVAPGAAHLSGG